MAFRVLLAEDDPLLREILCEGLAEEGFSVSPAENGLSALEMFRTLGPWDILLFDEEMPGLTGRQLLGQIRRGGDGVPALLISGNLHLDDAECAALGIGPVLRKPFSLSDLSGALRTALTTAK